MTCSASSFHCTGDFTNEDDDSMPEPSITGYDSDDWDAATQRCNLQNTTLLSELNVFHAEGEVNNGKAENNAVENLCRTEGSSDGLLIRI